MGFKVSAFFLIVLFGSLHPASFAQQSVVTRSQFSRLPLFERARFFEGAISRIAQEEQVDPNLLWTIAYNETRFRPWLRSPAGAEGLMQFIPATAARFNLFNPYSSEPAIRAAARYVRFLSNRFGGRIDSILAGYNAGEGAVDAFLQGKTVRAGKKIINPGRLRTVGGVPPYRETIGYVAQGLIVYRLMCLRQIFSGSYVSAIYPPNVSESVARVSFQDNEFGFSGTVLTQVTNGTFMNPQEGAQNQIPQFQPISQTVRTNITTNRNTRRKSRNEQSDFVIATADTSANTPVNQTSSENNAIQKAESGDLTVGEMTQTSQPNTIRARGTFFGGKSGAPK